MSFRVPKLGPCELERVKSTFSGLLGEEIPPPEHKAKTLDFYVQRQDGSCERVEFENGAVIKLDYKNQSPSPSGIFVLGKAKSLFLTPKVTDLSPIELKIFLHGGNLGYLLRDSVMNPGESILLNYDGRVVHYSHMRGNKPLEETFYK